MLKSIYNQKVTILNRLRRADGTAGVDVWYKHTLDNVAWYTDSARSAGGSTVFIGTYITILIPFTDEYVKYKDWKLLSDEEKAGKFTISASDYIVLGDVTEDINAQNVVATMQEYGDDVCLVRHRKECYDRFGATVQLKIEGV